MGKNDERLSVIIMAAGKGTRMNSDLPKVLHTLAGKSLLEHVLDMSAEIGALQRIVVVGHQRERVVLAVSQFGVEFAIQDPPQGTGHAVSQAIPKILGESGEVVVLSGDVPLLQPDTVNQLISRHRSGAFGVTVLSTTAPDPSGYGRIIRDSSGDFERIVEERDATIDEKRVSEINSGIYCFDLVNLRRALPRIKPNNSKGEYYLTDAISIIRADGVAVQAVNLADFAEICGINTVAELAAAEANFLARKARI